MKLTSAQRELLVEGGPCVRAYKPGQALVALGLWENTGDDYSLSGDLTPLGNDIRMTINKAPR